MTPLLPVPVVREQKFKRMHTQIQRASGQEASYATERSFKATRRTVSDRSETATATASIAAAATGSTTVTASNSLYATL
eukprot:6117-Heterococcus_DN1.PRE.3